MSSPPVNDFNNFNSMLPYLEAMGMLEKRLENDASGRPLYVGYSIIPNAPTNEKVWMIRKFYYDGNDFLNRDQLPDDGPNFIYEWDDRVNCFS